MKRLAAAQLHHNFEADEILYLLGDVNYCYIFLTSGEQILSSRTLKWYSERWPQFIRIHKGSLINPRYVHRCIQISTTAAHVIMCNGVQLPISRQRINDVIQHLDQDGL